MGFLIFCCSQGIQRHFKIEDECLRSDAGERIKNVYKRCLQIISKKRNANPAELVLQKSDLLTIPSAISISPSSVDDSGAPKVRRLTPLNEVGERQYYRRTSVVKSSVCFQNPSSPI